MGKIPLATIIVYGVLLPYGGLEWGEETVLLDLENTPTYKCSYRSPWMMFVRKVELLSDKAFLGSQPRCDVVEWLMEKC